MRGTVSNLATPHRLGAHLPALFHEDTFAQRLTSAFDEILAPVISTLDNIPAYLDPEVTPEDFLDWLAGWVGATVDDRWPLERRRAAVMRAVELYRLRGTARGLAEQIEVLTGGTVEIKESGGAVSSAVAGGKLPGEAELSLLVRLRPDPSGEITEARLDALVESIKPAHVPHRVELVEAKKGRGG